MHLELIAPLLAAALFGLVSGFNDGGNLMGSFTAGRVITPRVASVLLLFALAGPLLLGTAVAETIGSKVIDLRGQGPVGFTIIAVSPLCVVLMSWRYGIPTSMTLALVGAMAGWVLSVGGEHSLQLGGVARVLLGIPISVLGGGLLALLVYGSIRRFLGTQPHARLLEVARLQVFAAAMQAFAYGANDMEKSIGLIGVGFSFSTHNLPLTFVRFAPIIAAFCFFLVGALAGGRRVANRIGHGVLKVRPMQALSQQVSSATVVSVLALAGVPVSMTQTIDGGLVGVGAAQRASSIRWGIVRELLGSWLLTLPLAVLLAGGLHLLVRALGWAP
ncbi:MAG: inorganic phosphate transporter [Candidatus Dormiibacterota bacterium]